MLGLDIKRFTVQILGAMLAGWLSELVVQRQDIFGVFGKFSTPIVGAVVGLLGQYLGRTGRVPAELAQLLEYGGAFTVGNWVWEYLKKQRQGTTATITYIPPVTYVPPRKKEEERKRFREAIVI